MRAAILTAAFLAVVAAGCGGKSNALRIAVLLPLTGPAARDFEKPLNWALENVNDARASGRPIELVYTDTGKTDVVAAAEKIAADPSIVAVIGPASSKDVYAVANLFIAAKKPFVSPSAAAANIFRAFSSSPYVWRTVESDIAQTRVILLTAARAGARKVALVASNDLYGGTFFDWFGFTATELGLQAGGVVRVDAGAQSCDGPLAEALAGKPDVLVAAPSTPAATACIDRAWRRAAPAARLLFSSAARATGGIAGLGAAAEGLQGFSPAPGAGNGFAQGFQQRYGEPPTTNAANAYDALALLAYGLERSHGLGGPALARGLQEVVDARGPQTGWDKAGIAAALAAIHSGTLPDITGATGPLSFDATDTEPISSTYEHWQIEHGAFAPLGFGSTADSKTAHDGEAAFRAAARADLRRRVVGPAPAPVGRRTGLWAVLIATSFGTENYRHQADVLAQYQLLRRRGVPDSHIILISAGDAALATDFAVHTTTNGPNVNANVKIDYRLDQITADRFLAILSGRRSASTPTVVQSTAGDDVYVYIAGHGNAKGVYFGLDQPVPPPAGHYTVLTPAALAQTTSAMAAAHRYRRLLIAVEACQGGAMGLPLKAPNALLLSAASPTENSLSTNYDAEHDLWLSDQFSFALAGSEAAHPGQTLEALYAGLYLAVNGAHVSAYGAAFGDLDAVKLSEFISP